MRRVTAFLLTSLMGGTILLASSCATAPTPLAPGEVRLLRIDVPNEVGIKKSLPFTVNIVFEADGKPQIKTACFSFSGDGPYCSKVLDVS